MHLQINVYVENPYRCLGAMKGIWPVVISLKHFPQISVETFGGPSVSQCKSGKYVLPVIDMTVKRFNTR